MTRTFFWHLIVLHFIVVRSQVSENYHSWCSWSKKTVKFVECDEMGKSIGVRICYCLTVDLEGNVLVGSCLYGCKTNIFSDILLHNIYKPILFNSTADINKESCSKFNRKGLMCGECLEDYGYPAYSYNLSCVACRDYKYNWVKYVAAVYVPLTLFCIVIVVFRISANSGWLIGYVILSQLTSTYTLTQLYLVLTSRVEYIWSAKLLTFLYSFWNMNLFRSVYPSFCLHPTASALKISSLEYIIALYPLVAILMIYFAVQAFNYVQFLSSPVYRCFHDLRKELSIRSSLIESFATLFLISYVKVLNVTSNILTYTYLYGSNMSVHEVTVYNAPHVKYLGPEHLPYFILAVVMTILFNFLPFLLICLYPMRFFQVALHRCGLRCAALVTFMDAIQGSYKHDHYYRCFPGVFLFSLFLNSVIISTLGIEQYHAASSLNLLAVATLVAYFKPFKNNNHNRITTFLFGTTFCAYIGITFHLYGNLSTTLVLWRIILTILAYAGASVLPFVGILMSLKVIIPKKLAMLFVNKIKPIGRRHHAEVTGEVSLPYRYNSPNETSQLLRY